MIGVTEERPKVETRTWPCPLAAGGLAAVVAAPGLTFPFLSDDWHLVASVAHWPPPATPYEYFRPLYMVTYWLDRALWGTAPFGFHLTNLLLLAVCAALVVVLVRRYTGDPALALATGLLFALHPYHVENAAWIAVRGDPLYSILVLLALWAYDVWRRKGRGVPLAALALFAAALLAKETSVVLLPLLVAIAVIDRSRRPGRTEILRGLMPFAIVATSHFFVLRPLVLAGPGRSLTPGAGLGWIKHAAGFAVAAVIPMDGEILAWRPIVCGLAAAVVVGTLIVLAMLRNRGKIPPIAAAAALIFVVLLAPSIVGFQERYLYLPAAASCLGLARLLIAQRRAIAIVLGTALVAGWAYSCVRHWQNWNEAATASRALIADLVTASRDPETKEIVIANVPFRVRGGSVAGNFDDALVISGGRPMPVRGVAYVSYPSATEHFIPRYYPLYDVSRRWDQNGTVIFLSIPDGPFSHLVAPKPTDRVRIISSPFGSVALDMRGVVGVWIKPIAGRAAYAWYEGHLVRLEVDPPMAAE